jgi:hypothetical protein
MPTLDLIESVRMLRCAQAFADSALSPAAALRPAALLASGSRTDEFIQIRLNYPGRI